MNGDGLPGLGGSSQQLAGRDGKGGGGGDKIDDGG